MSDGCCLATPTEDFEKEKGEEEAMKKTPVNINGISLTLGELFESVYQMREFNVKLNLLNKSKGE